MLKRCMLLSLPVLVFLSGAAQAQEFPSRTVTIVSPYQAGGTSDVIVRVLAQTLGDMWGKTVVVENRPGANGAIGVNMVMQAPPDGHTLLAVASSALVLNPIFYPKLTYDVQRDLVPITRTGVVANVLVVNPSVAATSVAELIALAKAKPNGLTYASQGTGSNGHVIGELFKLRTGVDMLHVPYKGSAPAVKDLLGGHVQVMFDNLPSVLTHVKAGTLRGLAVTTADRNRALPDLPTITESNLPGFDASAWFAVLAAKGTPDALRAKIEKDIATALTSPVARQKLEAAGIDVAGDGSAALGSRIDRETQMWRDVIGRAGIKVQ
jgi:tripartite-type tricarboxylate transporter receptor subunit TctC